MRKKIHGSHTKWLGTITKLS
uniref:Uncharacterized protein n=1 Tax=Rhizophora mucronata TaxID=61149 RepID=A0A2P2NWL6_RHIMU